MFETSRLFLRGYRPADEAFFFGLFNTYDILVHLTSEYISPNTDIHRERLDKMLKCALFVVVEIDLPNPAFVAKGTRRQTIGFALVNITAPKNLDGEVGMALAKEYWGQGYATEIMEWLIEYSFRGLGLRRLSLFAFSSNTRAIALYEKVGFKHEGRKREAQWKEGEWVDLVWMGLLSKEYTAPGQALQNTAQWCVPS